MGSTITKIYNKLYSNDCIEITDDKIIFLHKNCQTRKIFN